MATRVELNGMDVSATRKLSYAETEKLLRMFNDGDESAKEQLIIYNLKLVLSVIQRFWRGNKNIEDIFQVGTIGLIKSIENFDITLNVRFSTYAIPMIVGEIRRYLRDNNSLRVPRSTRDVAYKALQMREQLERLNSTEASLEEIAKCLDLKVFDVVYALDAIAEPISIFEPVYNQNGDTILLMDQIGDDKNSDFIWIENIGLKDAIDNLVDKEKKILFLRYFEGKTQIEVSKEIGISQAQVSRLEQVALKKVKNKL